MWHRPVLEVMVRKRVYIKTCADHFADVPGLPIFHDRDRTIRSWPSRSLVLLVLILIWQLLLLFYVICRAQKYDCCTNKARHWYDWSVWPALHTFSATINAIPGTIDTTALAMSHTPRRVALTCVHRGALVTRRGRSSLVAHTVGMPIISERRRM